MELFSIRSSGRQTAGRRDSDWTGNIFLQLFKKGACGHFEPDLVLKEGEITAGSMGEEVKTTSGFSGFRFNVSPWGV